MKQILAMGKSEHFWPQVIMLWGYITEAVEKQLAFFLAKSTLKLWKIMIRIQNLFKKMFNNHKNDFEV